MNSHTIISLFHLFVNGPYMIYIGLMKPKSNIFYIILFLVGLLVLIDIIYKLIKRNFSAWYFVHLFLFAPLFLYGGYLGIKEEKIPQYVYSFLLAIGLAAFFYHLIKLVE